MQLVRRPPTYYNDDIYAVLYILIKEDVHGMKHYRKLLAVLLCIAMCASMLPTWAFAEGGDGTGLAEEAGEADVCTPKENPEEEDLMIPGAEAATEDAGEEPVEEEETPEAAPPEDAPEEPTEAPADAEEPKDDDPEADDPAEAEDEAPVEAADLGDGDEGYAERPGRIYTVTVDDGTDNAALLDAYAQAALDSLRPGAVTPQNYRVDRGELLTGLDKKIYDALWKRIQQVASGDLASTAFVIPFEELGLKKTYTFEELGVTDYDDGFDMVDSFFDFSFRAVMSALLADCCYSLYWYDKTSGVVYWPYDGMSGSGNTITLEGDGFSVWMSAAQEYWDGSTVSTYQYEDENGDSHTDTKPTGVDPKYGTAVKTAVQNANAVVTGAASSSDFDKLNAYKTWICDHVTYNDKAAQDRTVPYGNPWQLIWVFDGDIDTDVVCEGYAKAFQYLCELTSFQGAVGVYSVTGLMVDGTGAGDHMWNIVSMEDGKNYLVDVTNCDVGSIGAPDWLFMKGCADGGVADGYKYNCGSGSFASQVTYVYNDETKNLYDSDILTLSNKDYTPSADPTPADPELEDGKGVEITLGSEDTASASRTLIFKPTETKIYEITAEDISNSGSNVTAASPYVIYPPVRVTLTTADGSTAATRAGTTGTVSVRSTLTAGQEYRVTIERMSSGTGKYLISVKSYGADACGETAVWSYDTATAELTISGTGEMWPRRWTETGTDAPWTQYAGTASKLTVGDGITSLGEAAFMGMSALKEASLPDSVKSLGLNAFRATGLTSIRLPDSIAMLEYATFSGCGALTEVTLPNQLESIGQAAFNGTAVEELDIPVSLTDIQYGAFETADSLRIINYAGTKAQWSAIRIGDLNDCLKTALIHCTDGEINPLQKLSPPTDLAWHRFEEGHDVIGFMSFAQAEENPTRFYEYRIYRTLNGTDTLVRTDFTAVPGAGRDGNHVFVTSDEFESGDYYFTVTAVSKDPNKYADSDPVKSETWHYEKAAVRMATVTNIGIDADGMATWTMPADLDHYTGFMMEYRYRASLSDPQTGEGMRYPTLIRRTMGPGDESPSVSFMARVRQQGPGYYQWRVKLLSDDTVTVDKSLWSDWSAETQITAEQIAEYHAPNEFRNLKQLQKFCAQTYTAVTSIRFGLNEPFEFTEDVVIPENLMVWFPAPNNSVTVPAGKTLTLNGNLLLQEDITVAGTLVNNSTLALHNGNGAMATVTVTGSYAGTGRLYVNHIGKGHVADVDPDTYFTGIDLRNYERSHTDSDNKECVYIYTWNPTLKAGETLTLDLSSAQPKSSFNLTTEKAGLYVLTVRKLNDSAGRPGIHLSAEDNRMPDSQVLWDGERLVTRYTVKAGETLRMMIERTSPATGEGRYEVSAAVYGFDACGDKLVWSVSGDTLTISGEGNIWDGDIWDYTEVGHPVEGTNSVNWTTDAPWGAYEDTVKTVILGTGVTAVGQNAFAGMNALETLAVSASAADLSVGKWAFDQCDNLQRIELNGFSSDWKEDRIAEGNESLKGAKLYCEYGLAVQPKDGKETAIAVPCGTTVTLEVETVPAQGGGAIRYAWSSATDWTEDGSTQIINYENNTPALVTEPVDTFRVYTCTVTDELGNEGAVSFRVQYERPEGYAGSDVRWAVSNGVLTLSGTGAMWDYYYENGMMLPWAARSAEITKVVVEPGITVIGGYAFSYLPNLTEVSLPEGLVSIHADAFTDCVSLRGIDLPSSLTELRRYAFYGSGLERVVLPEGLASLPEGGFMGCAGLAEVTVPKSLTAVEEACFTGCEELKTVNYAGTPAEWNRIRIAEGNEALTQAFKAQFGAVDSSGLKLNKEYLLIQKGGTDSSLNVTEGLNDYTKKYLTWTTESGGENVIAVDQNTGAVTAKSVGTDYAVATLDLGYAVCTARCRVDVQESITELSEVKASLTEDKVTVELYRTDYTRVGIVLAIEQNRIGAASIGEAGTDADADTNSPADPAVSAVLKKVTWEAADKNKITDFFALEQVDDRYVQIVPKDLSPLAVKATKGSYKASIHVTVDDGTENGRELDPLPLTVTVKKTLPKLSAPAVKLNRFTPDEVVPVAVTGANVTGFRPENGNYKNTVAELSKELPLTVKLNPANTQNGSAKFSLICDLENWAVTAKLTLTVSSTWNAPKVTLKPASVNLYSGSGNDKAFSTVTVTPLAGMTHRIEAVGNNGLIADYDDETGVITVKKGTASAGSATVTVKADGQPVATLRVKVQAAAAKTGITAKAAGAIDLKMTNSPVTITLTGKNCNAGAVTDYDVHILCNNRKQGVKDLDVTDLFNIEITRDVITLREKRDPALKQSLKDVFDKGDAYTAVIETAAAEIKPVKITVKNSAKVTINVSYKTVGTIDVLRQGTSVTVTPTVKNWYERDLEQGDLHIYDSAYKDITDKFTVGFDGAAYRVTPKENEALNPKLKYYAAVPKDVTGAQNTVYKGLPVKMGTAKITQSTKAITLSKNDLYDRQSVILSVNDPTLHDIGEARVVLVDKSRVFAQPVNLGNGEFAIGFEKDRTIDVTKMKSANVQLQVFLGGNITDTPNARLSVKITLK